MNLLTDDLILRTMGEGDIREIARMWEYPHEISLAKAYEALGYMTIPAAKTGKNPSAIYAWGSFKSKSRIS